MSARVQACVKVVTVHSGTTDQAVSGVVDSLGSPFATAAFMIFGSGTLNTIESAWQVSLGLDDGVGGGTGRSGVSFNFAGAKAVRGTTGPNALIRQDPSIFGGASRVAGFTNVTAGGFTVAFTTNAVDGDSVVILCLGGSDLQAEIGVGSGVAKQTTTFEPAGAIFEYAYSGSVSTGTSPALSMGWATSAGQHGVAAAVSFQIGGNGRYQRSSKCSAWISDTAPTFEYAVSSWQSDGFTMDASFPNSHAYMALGGCRMVGVSQALPAATGDFTISTGIKVRCAIALSVGATAGTVVLGDEAALSVGASDGTRQASHWTSEDSAGSGINGAHYVSDDDVLILGTVAGLSSTIHTRVQITDMDPFTGDVTFHASAVSGDEEQVEWLFIGEAVGADPPIAYEDPCSIEQPILYMKVTTETDTFKMSIAPLRETATQGGYGVPRLIEMGPITKTPSDPFTGALAGQSVTVRNADTDRVLRAASATRTSFRGCNAEIYLTSRAQSAAGLPPRVLFAGVVQQNSADENLVHGFDLNDPIGAGYSVSGKETDLIRRKIGVTHFPNCPSENLNRAEQLVVGRRAPLDHAKGEGVVLGITVGPITFGGTPGTPTGTTLADLVADLQASKDAGTLDADWGDIFGHADCISLQNYGDNVPSDFDGLAYGEGDFIGLGPGDVSYYLETAANTGGTTYVAVLISSAAIAEVLDGTNGDPSLWIDETQLDPAELGNSVWMPQVPGYTAHWTGISADLFTDITGTDGVTRRYTLALFDPSSAYGLLLWDSTTNRPTGAQFHLDCIGAEDVGDGTGEPFLDYFAGYRHVLKQQGLQTYYTGAWLSNPQFLFADGTTLLDRIDDASFDTASAVWQVTLPAGLQMSATFGEGTLRDFITQANVCGGCQFASDDFGRYFVKVLDRRPSQFFLTPDGEMHETLRDRRHILPGFRVEPKPEWHINLLTMRYGLNEYTGAYDRDDTGGAIPIQNATSRTRHGDLPLVRDYPYLADDATASAVGEAFVAMFSNLPYVATYSRIGLCGLKDDVLQGVPMTHFNGFGANGFEAYGLWVFARTFQPELYCSFQALCVDHLLDAEDEPLPRVVADYPVNAAILVDPTTGYVLVNGA